MLTYQSRVSNAFCGVFRKPSQPGEQQPTHYRHQAKCRECRRSDIALGDVCGHRERPAWVRRQQVDLWVNEACEWRSVERGVEQSIDCGVFEPEVMDDRLVQVGREWVNHPGNSLHLSKLCPRQIFRRIDFSRRYAVHTKENPVLDKLMSNNALPRKKAALLSPGHISSPQQIAERENYLEYCEHRRNTHERVLTNTSKQSQRSLALQWFGITSFLELWEQACLYDEVQHLFELHPKKLGIKKKKQRERVN